MADDLFETFRKRIQAEVAPQTAWRALSFVVIAQEQTKWCWAALTESITRYFDANSVWTQQKLASKVFKCDCSGSNGSSEQCNQPWQLNIALRLVDRLARTENLAPRLSEIEKAINADKPLCAQIKWNTGGSHVAAITGYKYGSDGRMLISTEN